MSAFPCPGCGMARKARSYLCSDCWWLLKPWVRTALKRRDSMATARLMELRRKIAAGVPLEEMEIHP